MTDSANTPLHAEALAAAIEAMDSFASYDTPTTLAEDCIRAYLSALPSGQTERETMAGALSGFKLIKECAELMMTGRTSRLNSIIDACDRRIPALVTTLSRPASPAGVKGYAVSAHESDGRTYLTLKRTDGVSASLSCATKHDSGETIASQVVKDFAISTLEPVAPEPQGEAVAWQYLLPTGGWSNATYTSEEAHRFLGDGRAKAIRPLYPAPPEPVASPVVTDEDYEAAWEAFVGYPEDNEAAALRAALEAALSQGPQGAGWRDVDTDLQLKGRRTSPVYFPATGEVCEVSGPNCDDANGYTWMKFAILWQNEKFILYGNEGFWPNLHKREHILCRPLPAAPSPAEQGEG